MGGSADPPLVEPKVHLLQVASLCNSKHNGGANPIIVGSADPTTVPIFCTMSLGAMIWMIVKLVFQLAILGWLPNLHMELPDAENTCFAACNQIMISTCGTKLFVPKSLCT